MDIKLIWITPDAEKLIAYMARVSNPENQANENIAGLLKYCMVHGHWSIFEMASMCVEIETSRAISPQILRHRSFSFQEFSQRYAQATTYESVLPRRQDDKNRQNSIDDMSEEDQIWWAVTCRDIQHISQVKYKAALQRGIAKECARMLLPMSTQTKLYMTGSIRSWIHYFKLRCDVATQLEHRDIANNIKGIFMQQLPIIGGLL